MAETGGGQRLRAHIGHGIPYGFFEISDGAVFVELEDGGVWGDDVAIVADKQVIYAGVRGVTYAAYFPEGASVARIDEQRLEVSLDTDVSYFSLAAVLDEYDSLQSPSGASGSNDIKRNIDPVFADSEVVVEVGPGGMKAIDSRATDADGDTIIYSLEGPDAAASGPSSE